MLGVLIAFRNMAPTLPTMELIHWVKSLEASYHDYTWLPWEQTGEIDAD